MKLLFFFSLLFFHDNTHAQYDYPKNKIVFVSSTMLANCMLLTADQYPNAHIKLSPESFMKNFKNRRCDMLDSDDNWMDYLALSYGRSCDFATGKEEDLKEWILKQADNTIDPLGIFNKSMELNNGNLLNSLLTVHQLLRNNARWFSTKFYDYKSSKEESKIFWNKFIDIRGDLAERGGKSEGDHQGSWYRFWGMSIWRTKTEYVPLFDDEKADVCTSTSNASERVLRDFQAFSMALAAEAVKPLFDLLDVNGYKPSLKDLKGKAKMNVLGQEMGSVFSSYLADGPLNLSPGFRKKTYEKLCREKRYLSSPKK